MKLSHIFNTPSQEKGTKVTTTKPTQAAEIILPDGYDDTASPYFVREELRPHYGHHGKSEEEINGLLSEFGWAPSAWAQARAIVEFRPPKSDTTNKWSLIRAVGLDEQQLAARDRFDDLVTKYRAQFKNLSHNERYKFAAHLGCLEAAEMRLWNAIQQAKSQRADLIANTCPECGECDPVVRGQILRRQLIDGMRNTPALNSCLVCYWAYSQAYVDALTKKQTHREGTGMLDVASPTERAQKYVSNLAI